MRITVVYDNEAKWKALTPGWGFSCLVEGDGIPSILFDTGASGSVLLHNMEQLNVDAGKVGVIFISHGHLDHTGGLPEMLEANRDATLYVPASFRMPKLGREVVRIAQPTSICDRVHSTGELEHVEQSLVLDTGRGLMVVTGCSHPGVGQIIDAASRYGRVEGIVGGLHGFRQFSLLEGLSLICPCHCTVHKSEIKRLFPGQCAECGVGSVLEL